MAERLSISKEQATEILSGSSTIPHEIVGEIGDRLKTNAPLVDDDAFNSFVEAHMKAPYESGVNKLARRTSRQVIELGATSVYMAYMLAGDIKIPRPRRLGEHNQTVTNVLENTFGRQLQQPRDRILRVFSTVFQDGGKSYGVAVDGSSKNQKTHNLAVMRNILPRTEVLSGDAKRVFELLHLKDMVGTAIRKYHDKNMPFEEVIVEAEQEMDELRREFPSSYKDRADMYVDIAYRSDAGAHTQHPAARYVDIKTGRTMADVTNADRKVISSKGLPMTLDRLFSEAPANRGKLRFHRPKDLEVMRRLLPSIYGGEK